MTSATNYWSEPWEWLEQAWDDFEDLVAQVISAVGDFWEHPIASLQSAVVDVERWLSGVPAASWILVGVGVALLYWIRQSLRGWTRLGPIKVETIEHDSEQKAAVHALTAALRERLARSGISPPPAVPTGTPQADLIGAVEAIPIPQADWLAALIRAIPRPKRPAEYEITSVLTETQPDGSEDVLRVEERTEGDDADEDSGQCGVSFWVRPSGGGTPLVKSVTGYRTHARALEVAASSIHLHVSKDAVYAVPRWARWHDEAALEHYVDGCSLRRRDTGRAAGHFLDAHDVQPSNVLARMQLANLYEHAAPDDPTTQARALRAYLDVADNWPELVEARYRAAIVASALASRLLDERLSPQTKQDVLEQIAQADSVQTCAAQLRTLAARETKAVRQLLRPWYVLIREQRLRTQFEPNTGERRQLRHTVSISQHCLWLRQLQASTPLLAGTRIAYRSLVVRLVHVWLAPGATTWQTRYNVACFDALRYERTGKERVKQLSLRGLRRAIAHAGDELSLVWARRDPDFNVLHGNPDFERAVNPPGAPRQERPWVPDPTADGRHGPLAVPPRPWGRPYLRSAGWSMLTVTLVSIGVALGAWLGGSNVEGAWILLGIAALFTLLRARYAAWEWRLTQRGPVIDRVFPNSEPLQSDVAR